MFIGHFAIGLSVKAFKPQASLGAYFLAAQFVDLLWPTLLLLNLEQVAIAPGITAMTPLDFISYPYTHSLVMALMWSVLGGGLVYLVKKDVGVAIALGLCVGSHWVLDFITHRPDLPIMLNEATKVGLGLWNYKIITIIVEFVFFTMGVILYVRNTIASDGVGKYGFWGLIGLLIFIHIGNIFGPPPPSVTALIWAGHLQWLFVLWAYWVDGHRSSVN